MQMLIKTDRSQTAGGLLGGWKHGHVAAPPWACVHYRFRKGQFSALRSPLSAALGKVSFLQPRDQQGNLPGLLLAGALVCVLRSLPTARLGAVPTVYCLAGKKGNRCDWLELKEVTILCLLFLVVPHWL